MDMTATTEALDSAKARRGLTSDYQLAKLLGVPTQRLSNYRSGRNQADDDTALQLAELCEIDPAPLLARIQAERSKSPRTRAAWLRISQLAARSSAVGCAILAAAQVFQGMPETPAPTAFQADSASRSLYIM